MEDEKMYTEEEKNKLLEKERHKIYYSFFQNIQSYVDCMISSALRDFCTKNPAIDSLLEQKESSIACYKE